MNKIIIIICVIVFLLSYDYILPMSTITNYREDSIITVNLNRDELYNTSFQVDGILYNVERQYGFLYIASWCPSALYPCGG